MADKTFVVKVADTSHVHDIMSLIMMAYNEIGFREFNQMKALQCLWNALNKNNGICGIIVGDNGQIQGYVLLEVGEFWYSDSKWLVERTIFVHPDFREAKGGRARALCEFAKQSADSLNLPLMIGITSDQRTEAKVRLYERQFGKPSGAFFMYNAGKGGQQSVVEH